MNPASIQRERKAIEPQVQPSTPIPFNRPCLDGRELTYIQEAVERLQLSADGVFTQRCRALLIETLGCQEVLLTTSCTDALEMSALLLDIKPGDEVIVPSFTFVSTINAFVLRGAKPVFVDIRPDTLCLDETRLAAAITSRTRAIVPVHYAGVPCDMAPIMALAEAHDVAVVEDNAHGLFGRWQGRCLGTFGTMATLSFHETKNLSCGEGGALILNDEKWVERARILRDKGTNRHAFQRGQVDKYTWVDVGSSFGLSDVLAAMLYAQLESRDRILNQRRLVWKRYDQGLADLIGGAAVRRPYVPEGAQPAHHMYYLMMPTRTLRDRLIEELAGQGIHAVFHYTPLHRSEMALRLGCVSECPVTDHVSGALLRLPFYNDITPEDQARVMIAVARFCHREGL